MKNYQYILFDWDGCLARTLEIWMDAYKATFSEEDLHPSEKDIASKVFGDWHGPEKAGAKNNDEFIKKLLNRVNANYPNANLYENAPVILKHLRAMGKKIALVTSSELKMIDQSLINHDIKKLFDVILTAEDVQKHKPDPEIVFMALEKLGGTKEQAIIIGDSKSDLGAASNAAIDSALFYPESHQLFYNLDQLQTFKPNYIIKDLIDLKEIIL